MIAHYHPSVLWNDIDCPKSGHPLDIEAEYYNAVPDGVVDDRFGIKHTDYTAPEYQTLDKISPTKWEECRGLGRSFGYNRAEGEEKTIAPDELIYLLVDIVSKNGNLLLDVGPESDGTIPAVQMSRLKALGAWLNRTETQFTRHIRGSGLRARREMGSRCAAQPKTQECWALMEPMQQPLNTERGRMVGGNGRGLSP